MTKKIKLSSVLLIVLVTPFIMTYRLGIGNVITPYWLFGLIFSLMLACLVLDLVDWPKQRVIKKIKSVVLWTMVILVIGSAFISAIDIRHRTSPTYQIHDMPLQLESAIRFFLAGKNPYAQTYFETSLAQWHYSATEINPALYHFVMMPGAILFSLPFYWLSGMLFGFYDARMLIYLVFLGLLVLAWRLKNQLETKRVFLILLAFNPATLGYLLEGRTDLLLLGFLFLNWYWLAQKRLSLAGVSLAVAFAIKQSVWPIFPFYLAYLWGITKSDRKDWQDRIKKIFAWLFPFTIVFGVIVLPFVLWDHKVFWESTVGYLTGNSEHSYPISGYGWGMVLNQIGFIKDKFGYYPFWLWQIILGLPLMVVLIRWLLASTTVYRLIVCYGIFTFVFWYFSRYFNNSHLGYLSMVFVASFFWPQDNNENYKE